MNTPDISHPPRPSAQALPVTLEAKFWQRHLPPSAGPLLAIGWPESDPSPPGFHWQICAADDLGHAQGPFAAILWFSPTVGTLGPERARRIWKLLAEKGRLLLIDQAPDPEALWKDPLLAQVSEAGLASLSIRPLPNEKRLRLVVARRDLFRVRGYQDGDGTAILELFKTCFHPNRDLAHWNWKYADNPFGQPRISLTFDADKRLLAHYTGYPLPFHGGGGGTARCVQLGDTMVHPDLRSSGRRSTSLLRRTVDHYYADYSGPDVAFFFGFNTGGIQKFSVRFVRGQVLEPVAFRRLVLSDAGKSSPAPPLREGHRIDEVSSVGPAFDRLFHRAAPAYGPMIRRDRQFLDWRYLRCPDVSYLLLAAYRWRRLVAWGVFRRMDADRMAWVDALCHPRHAEAGGSLLRAALANPAMAGVETVEAWFPERPHFWHSQLEALGFDRQPEANNLDYVYRPHGGENLGKRMADLYYTMGDGDLF